MVSVSRDQAGVDRESNGIPARGLLQRHARQASVHFFGQPRVRVALALLLSFAACNVYDQTLIDGALGDGGVSGLGATGGATNEGGTGGTLGGGGSVTGGTSGRGSGGTSGLGGTESGGGDSGTGGTSGTSGSSGDGGEGDTGSGGTNAGQGGSGNGGDAGSGAGMGGTGSGGSGSGGAGSGSGGAGSGGGGAGGGGAGAGGAGMGGAGEVCTGCARLSVPLAAAADQAHFVVGLPAATDFTTAMMAFRVSRLAGTGGMFKVYIQEGAPAYLYQVGPDTPIASIGTAMQTINYDVATFGAAANKTIISRIGIEIIGTGSTSWANPTVIYIDSITVTGTTLTMATFNFDAPTTVSTTPTSNGPSDIMWLNNYSADTTVTGAALSWLGL